MHNRRTSDFSLSVEGLIADWSLKIVVLSVVVIAVATLYPFKFTLIGNSPIEAILENFSQRTSRLDIAANIVLFAPLGFGLASALGKRRFSLWVKLLIVGLISGSFSLLVEISQVFLPGRQSSPLDVVSNTLGGLVGFWVFQVYGNTLYAIALRVLQVLRHWLTQLSLKSLILTLVVYVGFASWLVFSWQGSSLKGWYDGFPLAVGNNYAQFNPQLEREVNGAWKGSVADLVFLDHSLTRSEIQRFLSELTPFQPQNPAVIAAYSLRGEAGNKDLLARSPDLVWQGIAATFNPVSGAAISGDHWLQSAQPLARVTNQIRQTSQFTISALIQPTDIASPASSMQQIISLAPPSGLGNFSISQVESSLNLIVTLNRINRSPRPYVQRIGNVFLDRNPHRFVITYSGFVVRVYVDGPDQAYLLDLTPNRFQIMLYLLILVPLAFLIGIISNRIRHHVEVYLLVVGLGTVLPAILLESFLAGEGDRTIRIANLLLGMLIMGGTILALKSNLRHPRQAAS